MPEFTLEGYTANPLFGATRNPWNPALTPGGSSGGAVAAVAAGMVPLAHRHDGGGSIRRPASHTGLVGLQAVAQRLAAREHALPPLLLDFEVIGPIARTVADARLLFDALRGPHAGDRSSLGRSLAPPRGRCRGSAARAVRRRLDGNAARPADRRQLPPRSAAARRRWATASRTARCRWTWAS